MGANHYVGLTDAAKILGTTKQTVRNWAASGLISIGNDPDVLADLNTAKSGRPYEFYYDRDQLEALRDKRDAETIEPDENYIRIDRAARALCITPRTLNRIRERQNLTEYIGTDGHTYLRLIDVAAQQPGVTYRTKVPTEQLRSAASRYGLTKIRRAER